jgi:dipeptidyl aminopeptidase/acylaminoacyl peptidase
MISKPARLALGFTALLAPVLAAQVQVPTASEPARYALPPKNVVDVFDAEPLPTTLVSPNRQVVAILQARAYPTIAELSQPMLRLAGHRVNPRTNGPHRDSGLPGTGITSIVFKRIADGRDINVALPAQPKISHVRFSPDGSKLAFLQTRDTSVELWIADTTTGAAKAVVGGRERINATREEPCEWLKDGVTLVCDMVPAQRGAAPATPSVPAGPNVQENDGKAAPAPTYEDLLQTVHDDRLFEYYFTSQLVAVDTASGAKTPIGKPAVFETVAAAPNGQYVLVSRIEKPYSHLVPKNGFPQRVEIWTLGGEVAKTIATLPSREGVPINGVETGPRAYRWRADQPAMLTWAEALDGGDARAKVPFRDKVMALNAPFTGQPVEIAKTEWRYASLAYTDKGLGLLTENDRVTRRTRTWLLEGTAQPRQVWERKQDAAYDDPGSPIQRGAGTRSVPQAERRRTTSAAVVQNGDSIYLWGDGATPDGDRPFVDRLNVKTLKTDRLFRSGGEALESFVAPLNDEMTKILTRYESQKDVPNYYVRDLVANTRQPITHYADPQPQAREILRQFVTYKRADGVTLSGTLYLPPGYKQGQKLPLVMWAYPREFGDADTASQVTGSPNQFTLLRGYSHMYLLLSGYAVFDNPTMPIVGPGETANDTYVEQLVASAEAAVNKVVELGVTDRDHIGVGGHSYGGFMTANLLAHTRLFRAGFAESGAYNRSLTPFGFQNERRTFWEVPDLYAKMSPFWYADKIKDPILLMHGEADDNTGTYPINSERLYAAIKGLGGTARLVMLPNEAHGYAARETLLHVLAERLNWFDKYVKNAAAKSSTAEQR